MAPPEAPACPTSPSAKMAAGRPGSKMASAPSDNMAAPEKRRPEPSRPADGAPPDAASFLLEAGVSDMVRAALLKVLEARPEEPAPFLAAYFEKLAQSGAEAEAEAGGEEGGGGGGAEDLQLRLERAAWALGLAHHSHRTAFDNNVAAAYDCLGAAATAASTWPGGRRRRPGVNGRLYSELLRRLCRRAGGVSLPEEALQPLLRKLLCREHEAVPFELFRYGALTCLVLLEFMAKAGTLYRALGGADRRVCGAVLGALEEALRPGDGGPAPPLRYLEAGRALGPDRLALAMDTALGGGGGGGAAMKKEDFLRKAAAIFLARVKAVD